MITQRQRELIDLYVETYPHLGEMAERAESDPTGSAMRVLGNAMSANPYPPSVTGRDALEVAKIGVRRS